MQAGAGRGWRGSRNLLLSLMLHSPGLLIQGNTLNHDCVPCVEQGERKKKVPVSSLLQVVNGAGNAEEKNVKWRVYVLRCFIWTWICWNQEKEMWLWWKKEVKVQQENRHFWFSLQINLHFSPPVIKISIILTPRSIIIKRFNENFKTRMIFLTAVFTATVCLLRYESVDEMADLHRLIGGFQRIFPPLCLVWFHSGKMSSESKSKWEPSPFHQSRVTWSFASENHGEGFVFWGDLSRLFKRTRRICFSSDPR